MPKPDDIKVVLATIHASTPQPPIKGFTDKVAFITNQLREANADERTREVIFLLATYCFDLARRLEYLTEVTRPFAGSIPPTLASQILQDNVSIDGGEVSWQVRATNAQTIMFRLAKDHDRHNHL